MQKEITWDFEITNEEEVNSFISYVDSENKYTRDVLNYLEKLHEDFLTLSKLLHEKSINPDSLIPATISGPSLVSSNDLLDIEKYVFIECHCLKDVKNYELKRLADLSASRDILVESKNITEFEGNIINTRDLVYDDRMSEAYLMAFSSRVLKLLTKISLKEIEESPARHCSFFEFRRALVAPEFKK